jgi:hypothetical protein
LRFFFCPPKGDALARQRYETPTGMAHFQGTGPAGKTCADCWFYGRVAGRPALNRCGKFYELTRRRGAEVPTVTPSCKFFAARTPPATTQPAVGLKPMCVYLNDGVAQ